MQRLLRMANNSNNLKPFDADNPDSEQNWQDWKDAFEIYLKVSNLTDPIIKKIHLLHQGGIGLQKIYKNLPTPNVPIDDENDAYKQAINQLDDYFLPKRFKTCERIKFRGIMQKEDSIDQFLLKLRTQALKSQLKGEAYEFYMTDQLISGCKSDKLRERLLQSEMSLDVAIATAKGFEISQNQSMLYKGNVEKPETSAVYQMSARPRTCFRCGGTNHLSFNANCPAIDKICHKCGKKNHFAKFCNNATFKRKQEFDDQSMKYHRQRKEEKHESIKRIEVCPSRKLDDYLFAVDDDGSDDSMIKLKIGGVSMKFLVDSGATCNVLDDFSWKILKDQNIQVENMKKNPDKVLKGYANSSPLNVIGSFDAVIETPSAHLKAEFFVVKNGNKPLLGKTTAMNLGVLKIGYDLNNVESDEQFPKIKNVQIDFHINKGIKPVIQPYRRVPIPLLELIEQKLNELEMMDIIEKVDGPSIWVSPIVPIMKSEKEVRICVDMRQVNKAILRLNHPLPTLDELLPQMNNCNFFTKLDISNAFHQLEIHPDSRYITTFISSKGLYRYKRLPFGISCAPEIYQKVLEQILSGCDGTFNYIDDIIIFAPDIELHDRRVKKVLETLKTHNVVLNEKKCVFLAEELEFLGTLLTRNGIKPSPEKVRAIKQFRAPVTHEELRSFLGLVNYVSKFIANLSQLAEPLWDLLKGTTFSWNSEHQKTFEILKGKLSEESALGFYNPKDKTRVIADAGPTALGAVLVQFDKKKQARVIYYASKTLSNVERRYFTVKLKKRH